MFFRHGYPKEIVSDQGREFCNQFVDVLEELTGFKHRMTSAYHPQSNGLNERFNQILKSQLQKLVNNRQDDWDDLLDNIQTSQQDSTKCTPFLLMYGREAHLPIDVTQCRRILMTNSTRMQKCRVCWNCRKSFMTKHMPILRKLRLRYATVRCQKRSSLLSRN